MDNEKIATKSLNMDEMDKVSGGTILEMSSIHMALEKVNLAKKMKISDNVFELIGKGLEYTSDLVFKDYEDTLRKYFGIKAKVSKTSGNVYHDLITGRKMSHEQVINRIKNFT